MLGVISEKLATSSSKERLTSFLVYSLSLGRGEDRKGIINEEKGMEISEVVKGPEGRLQPNLVFYKILI